MTMQTIPYMLAAIVVGTLIAAQPPLNAILARAVGNAFGATAISIAVAFITILVLLLFTGSGNITRESLASVPWWVYLAGTVGAIFVGSGVVIAPVTGALVFFVCIVAGQLLGSLLADHFGAFGLQVREVSLWRLAGLGLVLTGAVMVSRG
jgi:transporter family-2 protein